MTEIVRIRYWQQETMDSGGWRLTEPMSKPTAEKLIESQVYEQAEITPCGTK
jgi:hypothetical protein